MTTLHTLNKETSLLSLLINGEQCYPHYDKEGRLFIDRDPTHFRWMLNYLRDGYLVTVPASKNHRLEVLQEARYYSLHNLIALISGSSSDLLQAFGASKVKQLTNGQSLVHNGQQISIPNQLMPAYSPHSLQALQLQAQSVKALQSQQHYQSQLRLHLQQKQLQEQKQLQQQQQLYQQQSRAYLQLQQQAQYSMGLQQRQNYLAYYPQTLNETLQQYEPAAKKVKTENSQVV